MRSIIETILNPSNNNTTMKIQIVHIQSQEVIVTLDAKNRGTTIDFTEGKIVINQKANSPAAPLVPEITVGFDLSIHSISIGS